LIMNALSARAVAPAIFRTPQADAMGLALRPALPVLAEPRIWQKVRVPRLGRPSKSSGKSDRRARGTAKSGAVSTSFAGRATAARTAGDRSPVIEAREHRSGSWTLVDFNAIMYIMDK
jgi:hypothetical protein